MQNTRNCFINLKKLTLASASPRRAHFFRELGLSFTIKPAEIDETPMPDELPDIFVQRLAKEKAKKIAAENPCDWVVGADTVVVLDNKILGKPESAAQAEAMLCLLSGRCHEVWTGFAVCGPQEEISQAVMTRVYFGNLTPELIRSYVLTGEPLDKAGSYGIQGQGGFLVDRIEGSYSNVVGLPLAQVIEKLLALQVIAPSS
jgi:septum formation protein